MKRTLLSRRALLRGLGSAAIALPLLDAMGCARGGAPTGSRAAATGAGDAGGCAPQADGAGGSPGELEPDVPIADAAAPAGPDGRPKRFVALMVPNGTLPDLYFPSGGESDFVLSDMMAPFAPHRRDLLILKGVDNRAADRGPTDGHREGVASMLSGFPLVGATQAADATGGGATVDQLIAQRIGRGTRVGSLHLGKEGNAGTIVSVSWLDRGMPQPNENNPRGVFDRLFSDRATDLAALAALRARRQSILDGARDDYAALSARVSREDRRRIDAHLAAIRDVEMRLSASSTCDVPPATTFPTDPGTLETWPRVMMDLLVLALQCDVTRVATFVFNHPGGGQSYFPWLGLGSSYWYCPPGASACDPMMDGNTARRSAEHHEMSHDPRTYRDELARILGWHYQQTAYLVARLKATPEGSGTLFDNVLLFQGSEIATGPHTKQDMPYLLIGSAGGYFRTGRYLQYSHAAHNDLLVSVLNAFGVETNTCGLPDLCTGPLPGLR